MRQRGWIENNALMLSILLLAFLLRIFHLDAQSLWWDEAVSVVWGSMDLPSMVENLIDDRVHPPLYYLLLHFWLAVGRSEFTLRTLSAFIGVLTVSVMFPLSRLVGGKRLGVLGSLLLALSPFHIWYSQEVRMYSLAALLVMLSIYFLARILDGDKLRNWVAYGGFTSLALYTHYLNAFLILAHMTYLVLSTKRDRNILRKWILCMVSVSLLYAPWLLTILIAGGFSQAAISWISPAQPVDLFWTLYNFLLGSTSDIEHPLNLMASFLAIMILAFVTYRIFRGRQNSRQGDRLWLAWIWLALPLLMVFLISLDWPLPQKRSIYMDRFLIPLLPAFLILLSYGLLQLWHRSKIIGLLTALALLLPFSTSLYSLHFDPAHYRDQWREAIAQIRDNAQGGDLLLVRPHHYVPLYYYEVPEIPQHTVPYLGSSQEYEAFLNREIPTRLNRGGRIWTMIISENANPHRFAKGTRENLWAKVERNEIRAWLLENMRLLEELELRGVYLALYGQS
jgi:uncharacterized membrane protein